MSELTDDQLDGLFRKSAEEFEPPFDPAAWQDMKARLDANDHTRPGGTFTWKNLLRWGLPALLLLLLTGGGWYAYRKANIVGIPTAVSPTDTPVTSQPNKTAKGNNQPKTSRLADTDNTNSQTAQSVSLPEVYNNDVESSPDRTGSVNSNRIDPRNRSNASTERLPATAKANTITGETVENKTERATKKVTGAYKRVSGRNRIPQSQRMTAAGERGRNRVERTKKSSRQSVAIATNKSVQQRRGRRRGASSSETAYAITTMPSFVKQRMTGERSSKLPSTKASAEEAIRSENLRNDANNYPSASPTTISELAIRPAKWPQPLAFANRPVQSNPDTGAQKTVSKPVVQRGLSVRVAVAPDLSGVGLKNFSRPGTNVGLFLEYRLAARWSIQAGLIQSTKIYRTLPSEYTAPAGAWGGLVQPLSVDGRCNMFDIPINLRYDVILRPQNDTRLLSRWFVSGGVTSYVMKSEEYTYNYPPHTYNQTMSQSASTGGYGFSNLNLSVGYERALSKRLSWQVEPFMKVPLKGVGYFKVDLLSTGAFFSLRYKL